MLIFGNGRPFPGALLLRSEKSSELSDEVILLAIKPIVEKLNRESQDHARIPAHMLVPLPHQTQPLEKSSKGTIIRRAADARFERVINGAYESLDLNEAGEVPDEELAKFLTGLVHTMTSQSGQLTDDMDLFAYGVDSIACMQLRGHLKQLLPNHQQDLPMSIIEDCGTIRRLTDFILRKRHGQLDASEEDEVQLMLDLVKQYGSFAKTSTTNQTTGQQVQQKSGEVVVLTGATGALGAHILDLLQKSRDVDAIYCLVRGADERVGRERVSEALQQRGLADLPPSDININNDKVKVVQAQLSDDRLGLTDDLYDYLAREATSLIHVAWTVNFRLKLRSFVKDNIGGVRNLLSLALTVPRANPPRFTYCSSTASIMNSAPDASGRLPEIIQPSPSAASPLGYSRSKWVAEHICLEAHNRTRLHGRITVVRVGQLTGDSMSGVWNTKEAWPMMLSTARLIKCLPDLGDEPLDWLPVDVAAKAFLEITQRSGDGGEMSVYHVLNPHQKPTWHQMLQWLTKLEEFEAVEPAEWVRRLEAQEDYDHSAMKLLGLWKESYDKPVNPDNANTRPQFSMEQTQRKIAALEDIQPLDEEYVHRMWNWVQANVR